MKRLFIDFNPISPTSQAGDKLRVEELQAEFSIILGRRGFPQEIIPEGKTGPIVSIYGTTFEFLDLLDKFMLGEAGAAELIPLQHFFGMAPHDDRRARVSMQFNVACIEDNSRTPSFLVDFEELALEIITLGIGVYETYLDLHPSLEKELIFLGEAIAQAKEAIEKFLGVEELLDLVPKGDDSP